MNAKTVDRYLTLLHQIFVIRLIPAWSGNIGKRVMKHPKVFLCDSGLLAHLQGVGPRRFQSDPTLAGPLLENFVAAELLKQSGWSMDRPSLYHFRTHEDDEVDLVLERRSGDLVGMEVKARSTIEPRDFKGLQALKTGAKRKFIRGVVLYTGGKAIPYGDRLIAMPMSALWKL